MDARANSLQGDAAAYPAACAAALTLRLNRESLANVSVTRFVVALTSGLFFLRIFVLFVEAYSAVSFERTSDDRLLELCTKGAAADLTSFERCAFKLRPIVPRQSLPKPSFVRFVRRSWTLPNLSRRPTSSSY